MVNLPDHPVGLSKDLLVSGTIVVLSLAMLLLAGYLATVTSSAP